MILENRDFEEWTAGDAVAPDGWTSYGAGVAVAKEGTIVKNGNYSAKLTRNGADVSLFQNISPTKGIAYWKGKTVTVNVWIYATVANRARVLIGDGIAQTAASYHNGDSTWQLFAATRTIDASATGVTIELQINDGDTAAYFDDAIIIEYPGVSLEFGSYEFDEELSRYDVKGDNRIQEQIIAQKPGAYIEEGDLKPIVVTVRGDLVADTASELRTLVDTFLGAINNGKQAFRIFDDRYITAQKRSYSGDLKAALLLFNYVLSFVAETPFWIEDAASTNEEIISATPTTYNITIGGNAHVNPIITIAADQGVDVTNVVLENVTAGTSMVYTGTISSGESLVIDTSLFTIKNNAVDDPDNFGGDFLQLLAGTNSIKYTGLNCTITFDWYNRWF